MRPLTETAFSAPQDDNPSSGLSMSAERFALGAHLLSERNGYVHHGLYSGNGNVIHYAGFTRSRRPGPVEEVSLECFSSGKAVRVGNDMGAPYRGYVALARARSRIGERRYSLLRNNCEHFCTWCITGIARSEQVRECLRHPRNAARTLALMVRQWVRRDEMTSCMEGFRPSAQT
ncbi:lecithin retinol acyltransferase family protein [Cupriavidus sp. D39]|uniref:lecithin retinol acyltransferase family protein n=1 Tax=Cupriavidus sp. D39 TaxID=2997877 RepID=UPI00226F5DDB|nr:lecithin retinol acyltransferase family protein [Cupriavidus sp. D39]MCY0852473.1 lecithin retinol acyltransferase family protein [Cupriavidus sp. D39]